MIRDIFYKSTVVLFLMLFGLSVQAQHELSKQIEKEYALSNIGELILDNRYGGVTVNGWDRNSVKIDISVSVTHKKRENADKLLDRIVPEFRATRNLIEVTSIIDQSSKSLFSRYFNKINPFEFDKSNVQIDYTVYMPSEAGLSITNRFGDVIINDWSGNLELNLEHGDVWISENINNAKVEMKFGKLRAKDIDYATIYMKNGEVDLEASKSLKMNSSGSTIGLGTIDKLEMYSSKDEVRMAQIGNLRADYKFSNVAIETIEEKMFLTLRIAEVTIGEIVKPDSDIEIVQESSEININVTGLAFNFEANLEQGLLRIPKSFKNIQTNVTNKSKKIREVRAVYGNAPYGDFSINGIKGIIVLTD